MPNLAQTSAPPHAGASCKVAVIWIDWYAYHVARFRGLLSAPSLAGRVSGIELVGGIGVHAGLKFREELPADLPVHTLMPESSWAEAGQLRLARKLWRLLSQLDPDIVLVPGYYTLPAIAAALWARLHRRTSVLMTESTADDHARIAWKEWAKSLLIRTLFDSAVSGGIAHRRYLQQLGFPADRIASFYDVVDNRSIADRTGQLRAEARQAQTLGDQNLNVQNPRTQDPQTRQLSPKHLPAPYFLYVGRLSPEKNVSGLLQAWLAYRSEGGSWPLVLVGDGQEATALRALATSSAFASEVHFAGHKGSHDLPPYYAFAGCFVLPSSREPWGLVVNEAMAASLPVIVSDRCGCVEDLVVSGQNGLIFNPSKTSELRQCLHTISNLSKDALVRMGAQSQERIALYSPQNFGLEIVRLAKGEPHGAPSIASLTRSPPFGDPMPSVLLPTPIPSREPDPEQALLSPVSPPAVLESAVVPPSTSSELCPDPQPSPPVPRSSGGRWLTVVSHLDPRYGGLSSVVPQLSSRLANSHHFDVDLAAFCTRGELYSAENYPEITISEWPSSRREWIADRDLRDRFRSLVQQADALHIHGLWEQSTAVAAPSARTLRKPYILSAHGMLETWALANKRVKKQLYAALFERANVSKAFCLHALTHAEARDYRRFGATGPIAVIPNGVTLPTAADPHLLLSQFSSFRGNELSSS